MVIVIIKESLICKLMAQYGPFVTSLITTFKISFGIFLIKVD